MLNHASIERILTSIPGKTIGVLGDLFLDRYLDIDSARTEPSIETGLDAYQVVGVRSFPGALGTVINNLVALGVGRVLPFAIIGDDGEGYELRQALQRLPAVRPDGLQSRSDRRTPPSTKPQLRATGTPPRKTPADNPLAPPSDKRADAPSGKRADAPSGTPPLISLAELTAAWSGTAPQVGPLVLQVEPGQRLAITGPNGCGKSTLLAVLARQLDPSGGDYRLGDHDVLELDLGTVRQAFAVLDDEPHLFASTLRANLELARPGAADPELVDALDRAGLGQWFADLARGLETVIGAGGRGVSGGERARLGLARCIVSKRPVLLLDEPVAHLDHTTAEAVLGDLAHSTSGHSVVMVSHRPDGLAGFDRVIDLSHS